MSERIIKKYLLSGCYLFCMMSLSLFAETIEAPSQRIYSTFNDKNTIILLDRKSGKYINTIEERFFYSLRKLDDNWLAQVQVKDEKWGFMNLKGDWVVKSTLDKAKSFSEDNITRVMQNGKWFFFKADGKLLLKNKYNDVTPFRNGMKKI